MNSEMQKLLEENLGSGEPSPDFRPSQNSLNLIRFAAEENPELLKLLDENHMKLLLKKTQEMNRLNTQGISSRTPNNE